MTAAPTRSLLVVCALSAGCMLSNLSPQARFAEASHRLNDAERWGQLQIATQDVSPSYKARFLSRRKGWGEHVQIAEIEPLSQQLTPDKEGAVSEVSLSWTDEAGVTLRKSVITQKWTNNRGTFLLVEETVQKGDPGVFTE